MARAARKRDDASRERILETAAQLFARHGSAGMSLQMLADHVGLHKSTLFHHFASKEEILHTMLHRELSRILEVVRPLADDRTPELDHLLDVGEALSDHFARTPDTGPVLLRSLFSPDIEESAIPDGLESIERKIFATIGTWLEKARRAGVIRKVHVRQALVNLLGVFLLYPAIAPDDFGRELVGGDPSAPPALRARKSELRAFLRGAFAPEPGL